MSSLIIVKLPFAVPDPLREAEKERYATLTEYIRDIIVPDMQKAAPGVWKGDPDGERYVRSVHPGSPGGGRGQVP